MLHSDCSFIIGKSHKICEDYGLITPQKAVICSDGCSSGKDTDFGSRILSKTLSNIWTDPNYIPLKETIDISKQIANNLNLTLDSLYCTILTLNSTNDSINVSVSGDGAVLVKLKNGDILVYDLSFPSGYPHYPAYYNNEIIENLIKNQIGENTKVIESYKISSNGEKTESSILNASSDTEYFSFKLNDVDVVAITTDGLNSFLMKNENGSIEKVPSYQVIKKIMNFKVINGSFVQRQMNGFLKEITKMGWYNVDDFTVGAIGSDNRD